MNIVFVGVMGIIMFALGLYIRLGGFKAFYLAKGIPILMPRAIQNMFIPFGLTLVTLEIISSELVPDIQMRQALFGWLFLPMLIISMILGIWTPRWLRPEWLNYLEDEYGSVMWHLLDEAAKDGRTWSQRVRTQAGLEAWAEEMRERLGYPPHPGQIERMEKKREEIK